MKPPIGLRKDRFFMSRHSSLALCLAGFLVTFWFNVYHLRIIPLPNTYQHEIEAENSPMDSMMQLQKPQLNIIEANQNNYDHRGEEEIKSISNEPHSVSVDFNVNETIYGIMITGKDRIHCRLAEESILSFKEQDYPNKVLYIVEDGNYSFKSLVSDKSTSGKFKGLNIKIVDARPKSENEPKLKLGELRNLALDTLQADLELHAADKNRFNISRSIWVQWDDDDFHHPQYLSRMYAEMVRNNADAVVLREQIMYAWGPKLNWGDTKDQVSINPKGIMGTIMSRVTPLRYPAKAEKGEDSVFYRKLKSKSKVIIWDNAEIPHIYVRLVHGANTWQRTHFGNNKYSLQRPTPPESNAYLDQILPRYSFVQPWRKDPESLQCHY